MRQKPTDTGGHVTDHTVPLSLLKERGYLLEHRRADKSVIDAPRKSLRDPQEGTTLATTVATFLLKKAANHAFDALVASL